MTPICHNEDVPQPTAGKKDLNVGVLCYLEREPRWRPCQLLRPRGENAGTMAESQYEHSVLLKAMTEHNKASRPERRVWDGTTSPFMVDLANNSLAQDEEL